MLEGIETLTESWYNNNIWPRKEPGRTFNPSIIHTLTYSYRESCGHYDYTFFLL